MSYIKLMAILYFNNKFITIETVVLKQNSRILPSESVSEFNWLKMERKSQLLSQEMAAWTI